MLEEIISEEMIEVLTFFLQTLSGHALFPKLVCHSFLSTQMTFQLLF